MDPKRFYNQDMPGKQGADYEAARWHASPILEAQFEATRDTVRRLAVPAFAGANSLLEVGPGPGTWTKELLDALPAVSVTAVDISSEMLERARTHLAPYGDRVTYVEHDFTTYAAEQSFDAFFSSRAIEYMPDKAAAARSIASLLRPQGVGVLITKMPKPFFNRMRGRTLSPLHQGQVSPKELTRVFKEAGLKVERVTIVTVTIPGLRFAFLNRMLYGVLKHLPLVSMFSESYAVRFQKV